MSERNSASAEHAHHRKHSSSNKVLRTLTFVLTPFLMLLFVFGLFVLVLLKPYSDIKPYVDMVFDGDSVQTSGDMQVNLYHDEDMEVRIKEIELDDSAVDATPEKPHYMIYPYYGDRYGSLTIDSIGMKEYPVFCGWSADILECGIGWYNGSTFIGKVGNVVLAAHNHTYFYLLPQVKVGDTVVLETEYCKLTYIVKEIVTFHENDLTYIRQLPDHGDRLTMFTCWNNGRLGMSEYRLACLCDIVEREWKDVEVPEQ